MTALVSTFMLATGWLLLKDIPQNRPRDLPTSSGTPFYDNSVWVGVADANMLSNVNFYSGEDPILALQPESNGWMGVFHFNVSQSSTSAAVGTIKLILPRNAIVDCNVSRTGIRVSCDNSGSRKLVDVALNGPEVSPGQSFGAFDLRVGWTDSHSVQRLGFGKSRHVLLVSNAYVSADGVVRASYPLVSNLLRDSTGATTSETPTGNVSISAKGGSESFTSSSPGSDSRYSGSYTVRYRILPEISKADIPGTGFFREIEVVVENARVRFLMQVDTQAFFITLAFVLAELATSLARLTRDRH